MRFDLVELVVLVLLPAIGVAAYLQRRREPGSTVVSQPAAKNI